MFEGMTKIPRLTKGWSVSEKIDGTNAQIHIVQNYEVPFSQLHLVLAKGESLSLLAASKNRYIVPENDNFGFARWVQEHQDDLARLGPGRHYGEWFGPGIQQNPLGVGKKRLALFNPKWADQGPTCVEVVPHLGIMQTEDLEGCFHHLREGTFVAGAAPDAAEPEGIIAYHLGSGQLYKRTFKFVEGKWA